MIVITETFRKTNRATQWYYHEWTPEIISYVEENYIYNGKMMVVPEATYTNIAYEFKFVRIFQNESDLNDWNNDPIMIESRRLRDEYHLLNDITLEITQEIV